MPTKEDAQVIGFALCVGAFPFWLGSWYANEGEYWTPFMRFWGEIAAFLFYRPYSAISSFGLSKYNNLNFVFSVCLTVIFYALLFGALFVIIHFGSKLAKKNLEYYESMTYSVFAYFGFLVLFSGASFLALVGFRAYIWLIE